MFKTKLKPNERLLSIYQHWYQRVSCKDRLDYYDMFPPVARLETMRMAISISCSKKWPLFHLDIIFSFLNTLLEEEPYVTHPDTSRIAVEIKLGVEMMEMVKDATIEVFTRFISREADKL